MVAQIQAAPRPPVVVVPKKASKKRRNRRKKDHSDISAKNPNYITPQAVADANHRVMGQAPDLDVASCELANTVVRALDFLSPEEDGLNKVRNWGTRKNPKIIYMNPPGGVMRQDDEGVWQMLPPNGGPGESSQIVWLEKLEKQYQAGHCWGIYLSFNPEPVMRKKSYLLKKFPHCWFSDRPKFQSWDEEVKALTPDKSPRKNCLVILFPPKDRAIAKPVIGRFMAEYEQFGECFNPLAEPDLTALVKSAKFLTDEDLIELQQVLASMVNIRDMLRTEDEEIPACQKQTGRNGAPISQRGAGSIEWKTINGRGPYPYVRFRQGGVHRSVYVPNLSPAANGNDKRRKGKGGKS